MEPSLFVSEIPNWSIAACTSLVGFAILVKMLRRDVPAWLALIPEFAIRPIAVAQSSTLNPKAPATGATYLNVSPIIPTLVLELDAAFASTSAKCVALETSFEYPFLMMVVVPSAASPKAVIASVTMSLVDARSSPDAAARFIIPSILFSISPVFHPAIAMSWKASALSVALNFVLAPISFALSASC